MAFKQNNPLSRKTSPINKDWIKGAIKRPGAFRKKAEEAGMSTKAFAEKVTSNKEDYSTRTGRQAELAETLMGMSRHEKDHDDKTFTMDELNERSKKQDSLSKKQALKLPQREGLGNPDYEFPEEQRFAGDDGYDDGVSRHRSGHGKKSKKELINERVKVENRIRKQNSEFKGQGGSPKQTKRLERINKQIKESDKGISRESSLSKFAEGQKIFNKKPVISKRTKEGISNFIKDDKVYGPATAVRNVVKTVYKKGKEFVEGAAKAGHSLGKAVKKSKNVTGTGEKPQLMMKKRTLLKPKKGVSRKSSPINNKESDIDAGLVKEAVENFDIRRPKTQGDSIQLTTTMRRMGKDPQSTQDSRLDFYNRAGKKGGLLSKTEKIAAMKLKRNKKQ